MKSHEDGNAMNHHRGPSRELRWAGFSKGGRYSMSLVRERPGVYLMFDGDALLGAKCTYAGQASDLRSRMKQHFGPSEKNECLRLKVASKRCTFIWALVESQSDRDRIERFLIDYFRPECCDRGPDCEPLRVNLPGVFYVQVVGEGAG